MFSSLEFLPDVAKERPHKKATHGMRGDHQMFVF